jgi:hypothetical protein
MIKYVINVIVDIYLCGTLPAYCCHTSYEIDKIHGSLIFCNILIEYKDLAWCCYIILYTDDSRHDWPLRVWLLVGDLVCNHNTVHCCMYPVCSQRISEKVFLSQNLIVWCVRKLFIRFQWNLGQNLGRFHEKQTKYSWVTFLDLQSVSVTWVRRLYLEGLGNLDRSIICYNETR